jgi:hypothetical protein
VLLGNIRLLLHKGAQTLIVETAQRVPQESINLQRASWIRTQPVLTVLPVEMGNLPSKLVVVLRMQNLARAHHLARAPTT